MTADRNRDPVTLYDIFVGYKRRWTRLTAEQAGARLQLDPWEISAFIQDTGRYDTLYRTKTGNEWVASVVETGDCPSNHPMRGDP